MRRILIPIIFLILMLLEISRAGANSVFISILFIGFVIAVIVDEFYQRRINSKEHNFKKSEIILESRNISCYLNKPINLLTILVIKVLLMLGKNSSVYDELIKIKDNYEFVISLLILTIFYIYLHFLSKQILYKDGIKLMDNKFITENDIDEVLYRECAFFNKKIIEITIKKDVKNVNSRTVKFKCKKQEEFLKALSTVEHFTGLPARGF